MGRHSRRGPADKGEPGATPAAPGTGRRRRGTGDTPGHGTPRTTPGQPAGPDAAPEPAPGGVRGGHPEQREPGGGWGLLGGGPRAVRPGRPGPDAPGRADAPAGDPAPFVPGPRNGPRKEYLDAFESPGPGHPGDPDPDELDVFAPRRSAAGPPPRPPGPRTVTVPGGEPPAGSAGGPHGTPGEGADADEPRRRGPRARTYTGIAAAAVTTVLAVVVAGQVTSGSADDSAGGATDGDRGTTGPASRSDARPSSPPPSPSATPLSYEQKMAEPYRMAPKAKGDGKFETVPGTAKARGKGRLLRYRVDVEQGMGLDGRLFAQAVQRTLNDKRSWAHDNRAFERISSGKPDFVITLATPGTTDVWCRKSGLDITEDNVSCDSAATDRVMINAYRWAQGAKTYGDHIYPYRQMLINHEVGHRLGFNHVLCSVNGSLAPVMQQQTKFLTYNGITCKPNPWPFPHA